MCPLHNSFLKNNMILKVLEINVYLLPQFLKLTLIGVNELLSPMFWYQLHNIAVKKKKPIAQY